MKQFKKALRIIGFVLLIVLACSGLGLAGVVPIPSFRKKEDTIELAIRLKEKADDKTEVIQINKFT